MKKLALLLALLMLLTGCRAEIQTVKTKDIEAEPVDEKKYVEPIDDDTFKRTKLLVQKELSVFDFNDEHEELQVRILEVVDKDTPDDELVVTVVTIVTDHMDSVKRKTIEKVLEDNEVMYSAYDVDDLMMETSNAELVEIVVAFEIQMTKETLKK